MWALEHVFSEALTIELLTAVLDEVTRASKKRPAKQRRIDSEVAALDTQLKKGLREYMAGKIRGDLERGSRRD